jgi:hypothetical protein
MYTLDQAPDLRAVNPDIGERVVVERHQLGIGSIPAPPFGKRLSGGKNEIDYGHCWYSRARFCCTAQDFAAALRKNQRSHRNPAMHGRRRRAPSENEER